MDSFMGQRKGLLKKKYCEALVRGSVKLTTSWLIFDQLVVNFTPFLLNLLKLDL